MTPPSPSVPLSEVAGLFFRLGATAFGGPAAHIAMMEDEVVRRRAWVTQEEFLDLVGATNLIPGPNSTELAIHLGHRVAGWPGLVVAGVCFIVPATVIVCAIAWGYVTYGTLPQVGAMLAGIKPVVLAVVVQAIAGLAPKAAKTRTLAGLGVAALALALFGLNELVVLFGAGAVLVAAHIFSRRDSGAPPPLSAFAAPWLLAQGAAVVPAGVGLWPLFGFFVKVGSVLFGSGYVLLAFLRADLVERWGWLTEGQLLDAVAVGQVTPGPVFTTATFIGWVLAGPMGAVVATVGIFLPAFVFVAISAPLIPRLRTSPVASAFLDGVNVASLALMAAVTWHLAKSAVVGPFTALLTLVAAVLLIRFRVNSAWLVLAGGLAGWGAAMLGWR